MLSFYLVIKPTYIAQKYFCIWKKAIDISFKKDMVQML